MRDLKSRLHEEWLSTPFDSDEAEDLLHTRYLRARDAYVVALEMHWAASVLEEIGAEPEPEALLPARLRAVVGERTVAVMATANENGEFDTSGAW